MRYLFVITQKYDHRNALEFNFLETMEKDFNRKIVENRTANFNEINRAVHELNLKFPKHRPIEITNGYSNNNDHCIKVTNLFAAWLYEIKEN